MATAGGVVMSRRRWVVWALFAALATAAVIVIGQSAQRSANPAGDLAASLSCPSCAGQSVADSDSPVAAGMRQTIADQLAAGRTVDQVREWFTARYGPEVLRHGTDGSEPLVWALPGVIVVGALAAAVATTRRRHAEQPEEAPGDKALPRQALFLTVSGLVLAMVVIVAAGAWWIDRRTPPSIPANTAAGADSLAAQLVAAEESETHGDFSAAAGAYRRAAELSSDPAIRLRWAFALLRSGRADTATAIADRVVRNAPGDPDALLILGLAQRASSSPDADRTFARFLAVAPEHPAAAEVRRLLGDRN